MAAARGKPLVSGVLQPCPRQGGGARAPLEAEQKVCSPVRTALVYRVRGRGLVKFRDQRGWRAASDPGRGGGSGCSPEALAGQSRREDREPRPRALTPGIALPTPGDLLSTAPKGTGRGRTFPRGGVERRCAHPPVRVGLRASCGLRALAPRTGPHSDRRVSAWPRGTSCFPGSPATQAERGR